jgi:succinate dehydrogenase / fumarate reductase iron-sulfur subunit
MLFTLSSEQSESALDAASCIGCGACVATCKNASASLFTGAKITHLSRLPQGQTESNERVNNMVAEMDRQGFGACSFTEACSAACPQEISISTIIQMNKEYLRDLK